MLSANELRIGNLVKLIHKKNDILNNHVKIDSKHIYDLFQ
jgi:hypothetical protein